jgi:ketosteroid isomerase-like protein
MSQENVERLRAAYTAFAGRDTYSIAALATDYLHPDFELETTFAGTTVKGFEGLQDFISEVQESLGYVPVPEEFIDLGEQIVAVLRVSVRGAQSGVPVTSQVATVWTIEDGRAVHAKAFTSRAEALEAAGLRE